MIGIFAHDCQELVAPRITEVYSTIPRDQKRAFINKLKKKGVDWMMEYKEREIEHEEKKGGTLKGMFNMHLGFVCLVVMFCVFCFSVLHF
jgi:hypothetical protein